jgi:hypothetical protein
MPGDGRPCHALARLRSELGNRCGVCQKSQSGRAKPAAALEKATMMNRADEFTFQGQGTLKRIDTFVSKAGKPILTLVFETEGQYPQLIPIKVFGRLAEQASEWKPGMVLAVTGRLGGRDWNGKVYGDNVANTIEVVGADAQDGSASGDDAPPLGDDDVPF